MRPLSGHVLGKAVPVGPWKIAIVEKSFCWWPWLRPWLYLRLPSLLTLALPSTDGYQVRPQDARHCSGHWWTVPNRVPVLMSLWPMSFLQHTCRWCQGLWGGAVRLALGKIQASRSRQRCDQELRYTQVSPDGAAWGGMPSVLQNSSFCLWAGRWRVVARQQVALRKGENCILRAGDSGRGHHMDKIQISKDRSFGLGCGFLSYHR